MTTLIPDQETIEARVRSAGDAETLRGIVATIPPIEGSRGRVYTAQELLEQIDAAVQVPPLADRVTRALGLRDKVREIARRDAARSR